MSSSYLLSSLESLEDPEDAMEAALGDTSHMKFVDGRCSCCPYGYHIDLDFLRYFDDMGRASLKDLKRIHRDKKKQRKSMEVYLKQMQGEGLGPPPDVIVHSVPGVPEEDGATQMILQEIDSSMNAQLKDMMSPPASGRHHSYNGDLTDSDVESPMAPPRPPPPTEASMQYRSETHVTYSAIPSGPHPLGKSDSLSSVDSQSTFSSEQLSPTSLNSSYQQRSSGGYKLSSAQIASSLSAIDLTGASPQALSSFRDQVALILQRMRELEEQVKMIPVLQVRISVLKEEKRLLMLQLKAKSNRLNMRSIGVGERLVSDNEPSLTPLHRPSMRSVGCGEFGVSEDALLLYSGGVHNIVRVHEREIHTQQNTESTDREVRTVFLGQSSSGMLQQRPKIPPMVVPRRTRSVGVGDGNVFSNGQDSSVHVHEKELRTVFVGSETDLRAKPSQRNVGILCKPPVRDVGVNYMSDTKRDISIGVNEIGFDGTIRLGEGGGDMEGGTMNQTTINQMMQQINMASRTTRHIHIKEGMLAAIIDEKLRKDLHSQQTQTDNPRGVNQGVQAKVTGPTQSRGVGDDTTAVIVRPIVDQRSVAVENRPTTMNRSALTERQFTIDVGTNTYAQTGLIISKGTNTTNPIFYPASTNTDVVPTVQSATETDTSVFRSIRFIKDGSSNTPKLNLSEAETNTDSRRQLDNKQYDFSIRFESQGTQSSRPKHTWDRGVNPEDIRSYDKAVNTQPEPKFNRGVNTDHLQNVLSRGMNTEQARTYNKGVGDDSVDETPLSPTTHSTETVVVKKVTECENCAKLNQERLSDLSSKGSATTYQSSWEQQMTGRGAYGQEQEDSGFDQQSTQEQFSSSQSRRTKAASPSRANYSSNVLITGSSDKAISLGTALGIDLGTTQGTESSSSDSAGETTHQVVFNKGPGGGTQMRVIEHVETSYVGRTPVKRSTNVVMHDSKGESQSLTDVDGAESSLLSSEHGGGFSMSSSSTSQRSGGSRSISSSGGISGSGGISSSKVHSSGGGYSQSGSLGASGGSSNYSVTSQRSSGGSGGAGRDGSSYSVTSQRSGGGSLGASGGSSSYSVTSQRSGGGSDGAGGDGSSYSVTSQRSGGGIGGAGGGSSSYSVTSQQSDGGSGDASASYRTKSEHHTTSSSSSATRGGLSEQSLMSDMESSLQPFDLMSGHGAAAGGQGNFRVSSTRTMVRTVNGQVVEERSESSSNDGATLQGVQGMLDSGITLSPEGPQFGDHMFDMAASIGSTDGSDISGHPVLVQSAYEGSRSLEGSPSPNGTLRSIMKKNRERTQQGKKGISFSEDVVGGSASSSQGEEEEEEEEEQFVEQEGAEGEEELQEEEEEERDSEDSYDEGSYDGRQGRIVYMCKDNEAIEGGRAGAHMHEMSEDMQASCAVYAQWLEDSTQVTSKQMNSSLNVIQREWFKVSSHKLSSLHEVEDYLNAFNTMSRDLLVHIVNMADANGNTALHYAVSHCNMEIVNLLLDTPGIQVNKQNRAGYTAIMLASLTQMENGQEVEGLQTERERSIVKRLFQMGDINAQAKEAGQTALMLAVSHGKQAMVELLLDAGANVNMQDEDGSTALMCAAEHGHSEIVRMLLSQPHADATIVDNDGSTALSIAMEKGHREIGVKLYAHTNMKTTTSSQPGRPKGKKKGSRSGSTS